VSKKLLIESEIVKIVKATCNWCDEEKRCFQASYPVRKNRTYDTGEITSRDYTVGGQLPTKKTNYLEVTDV
jgi:hypothetical protein